MSFEEFKNETKNYYATVNQWHKFIELVHLVTPIDQSKGERLDHDIETFGQRFVFSFSFRPSLDKPGLGKMTFSKDGKPFFNWNLDAAGKVTYDASQNEQKPVFDVSAADDALAKDKISALLIKLAQWDGQPR